MADILIFQLRAPLASFGNGIAELRMSDKTPRKSAVTGLLGAALGNSRDDTVTFQNLVSAVNLAVFVLKEPLPLTDFHTIQAPMKLHAANRAEQLALIRTTSGYSRTIVTRREYLQDGHWLVALCGDIEQLVKWKAALEAPKFTLYLGRKSCVLSAFTAPILVSVETVEAAATEWSAVTGFTLPLGVPLAVRWDKSVPCASTPIAEVRRNDIRTSQMKNQFTGRAEYVGTVEF